MGGGRCASIAEVIPDDLVPTELYLGSSDLLPQAHEKNAPLVSTAFTLLGFLQIFVTPGLPGVYNRNNVEGGIFCKLILPEELSRLLGKGSVDIDAGSHFKSSGVR